MFTALDGTGFTFHSLAELNAMNTKDWADCVLDAFIFADATRITVLDIAPFLSEPFDDVSDEMQTLSAFAIARRIYWTVQGYLVNEILDSAIARGNVQQNAVTDMIALFINNETDSLTAPVSMLVNQK